MQTLGKNFFIQLLPYFSIAVPALILLVITCQAHFLPYLDYWYLFEVFFRDASLYAKKHGILFTENEHFITFAAYTVWLNYKITGGSNLALCLLIWFMTVVQAYILFKHILKPENHINRIILYSIFAVLVFPLAAQYNYIEGFCGLSFVTANFFVVFSAHFFVKYISNANNKSFLIAMLILLIGNISFSTSLFLWPVYLFYFLMKRRTDKWQFLLCLILSVAIHLFFFQISDRPDHHPNPGSQNISKIIVFAMKYLGGVISIDYSIIFGVFGTVIAIALGITYLKQKDNHPIATFWIIILAFCLCNAFATAIFRTGFTPLHSRYASITALFWLSLIIISLRFKADDFNFIKLSVKKLLIISLSFAMISYGTSATYTYYSIETQNLKKVVSFSLLHSIKDPELIRLGMLPPFPDRFPDLYEFVKETQHLPFNTKLDCMQFGEKINDLNQLKPYLGEISGKKMEGQAIWKILAESNDSSKQTCLLALDSERKVVGVAFRLTAAPKLRGVASKYYGYFKTNNKEDLKLYLL